MQLTPACNIQRIRTVNSIRFAMPCMGLNGKDAVRKVDSVQDNTHAVSFINLCKKGSSVYQHVETDCKGETC